MSDDNPLSDLDIADTWTDVQPEPDEIAEWTCLTKPVSIVLTPYLDDTYIVSVRRTLSADEYTASVETTSMQVTSLDEAGQYVCQFASDLDDSSSSITAVAATEQPVGDDDEVFVHFHCVYDDLTPVDPETITFDPEAGTIEPETAWDLDEDDDIDGIPLRIDIYPVHIDEVDVEVEDDD